MLLEPIGRLVTERPARKWARRLETFALIAGAVTCLVMVAGIVAFGLDWFTACDPRGCFDRPY